MNHERDGDFTLKDLSREQTVQERSPQMAGKTLKQWEDKDLSGDHKMKRFRRVRGNAADLAAPKHTGERSPSLDFDDTPETQLPPLVDDHLDAIDQPADDTKATAHDPVRRRGDQNISDRLVVEPEPRLPSRIPPLWERLPRVMVDTKAARQRRLPWVDLFRNSGSSKAIDLLRTRLLHTLRAQGWRRVAVAAPTSGCGTTFTAVNLAQSLARVPDSRTLVMDMNFRSPGLAKALGLTAQGNMVDFLNGNISAQDHLMRVTNGLAIGVSRDGRNDAAEILHDPQTAEVIDELVAETSADVALFDVAPVLEHDDLSAFLPQVDGVLLIADGTRTTAKHLAACEKILSGHTQMLGVVLNRARAA